MSMTESYLNITPELSRQIKLLMTDVDGTLTSSGDSINSSVLDAIKNLKNRGITIGLVSGRTVPRLESMARNLGINGPIIAENGGVAKLKPNSKLVDLGYSRRPAITALKKLKSLFPGCIKEREDNKDRLVDIVFSSQDVPPEELRRHLNDTQLLDSGYILHLMENGISKGRTLMTLLGQLGYENISPAEVLVVGDSATDLSLFDLFPHSVLIFNPRLSAADKQLLQESARYISERPDGEGFTDMALHIINTRT